MLLRVFLLCIALVSCGVWAKTYPLPADDSRLVGQNQHYIVKQGDTLASIANHFDIGFLALRSANPKVDPFLPTPGTELLIPLRQMLPEGKREGIVVNLAQLRLFFFRPKEHQVDIFPIGIGRIGWDTPTTTTYISQKIPHPSWTPTQHIRDEYAAKGKPLPKVVPAGPDNPLGDYAMRLAYGAGDYLIHGTNKNFGVGLRVSSGCMRLFPRDIKYLFSKAKKGMSVRIINQPVQYARQPDGTLYLEVTRPLSQSADDQTGIVNLPSNPQLIKFITQAQVDSQKVSQVLRRRSGYPELISQ
ncbi:L,D-transpeptidase family protein [Celerinatantimonas sp. MCCC 1A17872]|uniref:L,D-transpeptidase family protein n=1 Tax=Celerinatantimonas sp. MCCC 1A17872 TaxID=3177514 RepID=UPI0038C10EC9